MENTQLNMIIVLRNDTKEAWETSDSYRLQEGEVGVGYMTRTMADGSTKKVPLVKIGAKDALGNLTAWKDLPQAEGVFEQDQIITRSFGKYTTSDSKPVNAGGAGMTTSEWLMSCLSEVIGATITQPSYTLSTSTVTTNTGNLEIGSKVTKLAWNGDFKSGSYSYGSKTDTNNNGVIDDDDTWDKGTGTGVTATYAMTSTNAGTFSGQTVDGTLTLTNPIVIADANGTACGSISGTCTWTASTKQPVNNIGQKDGDPIASSSSSRTATYSVTGYREGFFYGTVTNKLAASEITSSVIRGLSKTGAKYSSGAKTFTIPVGAATVIFACPKANTGITDILNTTVNAGMNDAFKVSAPTVVSVGGADATAQNIGSYAEDYNVWFYTPAEAYGSTAALTITLG